MTAVLADTAHTDPIGEEVLKLAPAGGATQVEHACVVQMTPKPEASASHLFLGLADL